MTREEALTKLTDLANLPTLAVYGGQIDECVVTLQATVERLKGERDQARKAINDFGHNPNGFDWAFLAKMDEMEERAESAEARLKEVDELAEAVKKLRGLEWSVMQTSGEVTRWHLPASIRDDILDALSRFQAGSQGAKEAIDLATLQATVERLESANEAIEAHATRLVERLAERIAMNRDLRSQLAASQSELADERRQDVGNVADAGIIAAKAREIVEGEANE